MNEETPKAPRVNLQSIVLILLIMAGVGIIALLQSKKSSPTQPPSPMLAKGAAAPNFTLPDLDGKMVSLMDHRGKVVLLNIWATWCPPCVEEMPSMEKLHQTLKDDDFKIIAVSIDATGANVVSPFMKKHNLSFTALSDTTGAVKNLYRTTGIPESFIIDKDGKVLEIVIGPRDWASPGAIQYFKELVQRN